MNRRAEDDTGGEAPARRVPAEQDDVDRVELDHRQQQPAATVCTIGAVVGLNHRLTASPTHRGAGDAGGEDDAGLDQRVEPAVVHDDRRDDVRGPRCRPRCSPRRTGRCARWRASPDRRTPAGPGRRRPGAGPRPPGPGRRCSGGGVRRMMVSSWRTCDNAISRKAVPSPAPTTASTKARSTAPSQAQARARKKLYEPRRKTALIRSLTKIAATAVASTSSTSTSSNGVGHRAITLAPRAGRRI